MICGLSEALFAFFYVGYFLLNFGGYLDASTVFETVDTNANYKHWIDIDYRPVKFSDLIYKAQVVHDREVEVIDGPILLENPPEEVYFVITSDNHMDYVLTISPNDSRIPTTEMEVKMELLQQPTQKEIDIVVIEALDNDLHVLARTTILIIHGAEYDPYRLLLKAENNQTDFVILNRFYFKMFLIVLIATAMLLWIVETHAIVRKLRYKNQKKIATYSILQNV